MYPYGHRFLYFRRESGTGRGHGGREDMGCGSCGGRADLYGWCKDFWMPNEEAKVNLRYAMEKRPANL